MMQFLGMAFVVCGTSAMGLRMAWAVRREIQVLEQLTSQLQTMRGEISYHRTPLPQVMAQLSNQSKGGVANFWKEVGTYLKSGAVSTVFEGVRLGLSHMPATQFSTTVENILKALARGLGQFQLETQVGAIDLALERLEKTTDRCRREQAGRVKSYCTLGICGGLAMVIMLA